MSTSVLLQSTKRLLLAFIAIAMISVVVTPVAASAQTPICRSAASDSDGDGWGWEDDASCRVASSSAQSATPPAADTGFCDYTHADQNGGWGWNASTGESCEPLDQIFIGTEHSYFTWTFNRIRTRAAYDTQADLVANVSGLFAEYDPLKGPQHPGSKSSQKRQYNYNRNIGWALLGVDKSVNNQTCCDPLHLAFVWDQMPKLVENGAGIFKGRTTADRQFFDSWNAATKDQRLAYLGLNPVQFEKALPFFESASVNLGILNDYKSARFDAITAGVFGLVLSAITVGALPPGTNIFVQGAVGGSVAAGTSTLILTGDLHESVEAAAGGAIWGGITGWVSELSGLEKILGDVVLAAAKAELEGDDPEAAALVALTAGLTGAAIEAVGNNITLETIKAEALAELTPVFGASLANKFVDFAASSAHQMMAEITVLYLLDDDIDIEAEANRVLVGRLASLVGNEARDILRPLGYHIGDVVGAALQAGVPSNFEDEDAMEKAVARTLAPVASTWAANYLDDESLAEVIILALGEVLGKTDDQPNADQIKAAVLEWIKENLGVDFT